MWSGAWQAYRLRLKRRRLLWRALRARHALTPIADRSRAIRRGDILAFATVRNESARLGAFLDHYRRLGVAHFLFVDNDSTDGGAEHLAAQPDVSVWRSGASYRAARFGMDWINWLLMRHGAGHWCLTVDADELLVYPGHDSQPLPALTAWLDGAGVPAMAALMLDLYPRGALSRAASPHRGNSGGDSGADPSADPSADPGADPVAALGWFDAWGYDWCYLPRHRAISIRGGVRQRVFFADRPELAPHLHKTPLVRWRRSYAYLSSTHVLLPRQLNVGFDARLERPTGVLLHTKFLPEILAKSAEDRLRREHFTHAERYDDYYRDILDDPDLWSPEAQRYEGWRQLAQLGLMQGGRWAGAGSGVESGAQTGVT